MQRQQYYCIPGLAEIKTYAQKMQDAQVTKSLVNMSDYFIKNFLYQKKIMFLIYTENFNAKFGEVLIILRVINSPKYIGIKENYLCNDNNRLASPICHSAKSSDFVTCASCIFCAYFCLWDAKFLILRVPGCNSSALDKLLGQLGIYATWLSSIAYLQKQLSIFIFFKPHFFFCYFTFSLCMKQSGMGLHIYSLPSSAFLKYQTSRFYIFCTISLAIVLYG